MKKITLLFSLIFLTVFAKAQDEKFTGIGIFKINSDTATLLSYAKDNKVKLKNMNDESDYAMKMIYSEKAMLYRLNHNSDRLKDISSLSHCPDLIEFFLTKYVVSGIQLENLELKYYKNQLISVKCKGSNDIEIAMNAKYGNPVKTSTSDTAKCIYNLTGNERKLVAMTYHSNWTNDNISALSSLHSYFNDKCEQQYLYYFIYEVKSPDAISCDISNSQKDSEPKVDKSKLKDF